MSGAAAERLAVAAVTAAACAAALLALGTGSPQGGAPTVAELARLAEGAPAARLHRAPAAPEPRGAEVFCRECHPAVPHRGRGVAEAVLNAHGARLDCLACHGGGARDAPRWLDGPGEGMFASALAPERLTREALAGLRAEVAARRPCFERGPGCAGCHRPGGMGAWARPGAPAARASSLERLDAVFSLAPGEKWYFPQFP